MEILPSSSYMNIDGILTRKCGEKYAFIINEILSREGECLFDVLNKYALDDTWEQTSLGVWIPVLEKLHLILSTESSIARIIICLRFLTHLLHNTTNKRFFLSIEICNELLQHDDLGVVEATLRLLQEYCTPPLTATRDAAYKETVIVLPLAIAETLMQLIEGMSFHLSSYSVIDYLHGNDPMLCPSDTLIVQYPGDGKVEQINVNLANNAAWKMAHAEITLSCPSLTTQQQLNLKYLLITSFALRKDILLRWDIVRLRLLSFYSLIHCHVSSDTFESVVSHAQFLRDLVVLADVSSHVHLDFGVNVEVATLATRCLVGVLDTCIQRKKSYARYATVVAELGLNRSDDSSTLQDMSTYSVLLAACSLMTAQPGNTAIFRYIAAALELTASALSLRDYAIVNEGPSMLSVIGILHQSCDLLQYHVAHPAPYTASCLCDLQIIINACHSLEVAIASQRDRDAIVRDNDGIELLIQIMQIFVDNNSGDSVLVNNLAVIEVANSVISLVSGLLISGRSHLAITADTTMQFLYHEKFPSFCRILCTMQNDTYLPQDVFCSLMDLFICAIDVAPAYLGAFMNSNIATTIFNVLRSDVNVSPLYNSSNNGAILYVVLSLIHAMAITSPGVNYVKESGIITKVIKALIHPNFLPPHGLISIENISNIGMMLQPIMRDYEELRSQCHSAINGLVIDAFSRSCSRDCKLILVLRVMVLLKYLGLSGETRLSSSSPLLRMILNEKLFESVISAVPEFFPPGRQLCTQISQRTSRPLVYLGDFTVLSAVTSLMRTASLAVPHTLLSSVFQGVEALLRQTYEAKARLIKCNTDVKTFKADDNGFKVLCEIPDVTICCSTLADKEELLGAIGHLLRLLLSLEWCANLISQCLKTPNHVNVIDARLFLSGQDLLRRLFSLYRSTLIELSSFMASRLEDKSTADCDVSISTDIVTAIRSNDTIYREAPLYRLRIILASGALIRDGPDIDTSRIVMLLPYGSIVTAYERRTVSGNVVRYRTKHGWLSEFNRDTKLDPIVELIDCGVSHKHISEEPIPSKEDDRYKNLLLTVREATGYAFTRLHTALQKVASCLADAVFLDDHHGETRFGTSSLRFTEIAPLVSASLAKISARLLGKVSGSDISATGLRPLLVSANLYYSNAIMSLISPILNHKSVHLNVYLVHTLYTSNAIDGMMEVLSSSVHNLAKVGNFANVFNAESPVDMAKKAESFVYDPLSQSGVKCVLSYLRLMRKLVSHDAYINSPIGMVLSQDPKPLDGVEVSPTVLIGKITAIIAKKILDRGGLLHSGIMTTLPMCVQIEWFGLICDMIDTLEYLINPVRPSMPSMHLPMLGGRDRSQRALERLRLQSASGYRPRGARSQVGLEDVVSYLVNVGFTRQQIVVAIMETQSRDVSVLMDYLHNNDTADIGEGTIMQLISRFNEDSDRAFDDEQLLADLMCLRHDEDSPEPIQSSVPSLEQKDNNADETNSSTNPSQLLKYLYEPIQENFLQHCRYYDVATLLNVGAPCKPVFARLHRGSPNHNFNDIMRILRDSVLSCVRNDSVSPTGYVHYLLHYLHDASIMKEANINWEDTLVDEIADACLSLLSEVSDSKLILPPWTSYCFLILYEILINSQQSKELREESKEDTVPLNTRTGIDEGIHNEAMRILSFMSSGKVKTDGSTTHAILLALSANITKTEFATQFVFNQGLDMMLNLPACTLPEAQSLLTIILQHCMETPLVLRYTMIQEIRNAFKKRIATSEMSYKTYLKLTQPLYIRNRDLFMSLTVSVCKITRTTESHDDMMISLNEHAEEEMKLEDIRHDPHVLNILEKLRRHIRQAPDSLFPVSACLMSMADVASTLRGVSVVFARYHNGPDYMTHDIIRVLSKNKSEDVAAANRLLSILCVSKGSARKTVLDGVLGTMRSLVNHAPGNLMEVEHERLSYITNMGKLLSLLVTACKLPRALSPQEQEASHVSVDTVHYLWKNGSTRILTDLLATISLKSMHDLTISALEALIDPLELLTRVKLLNHLHSIYNDSKVDSTTEGENRESLSVPACEDHHDARVDDVADNNNNNDEDVNDDEDDRDEDDEEDDDEEVDEEDDEEELEEEDVAYDEDESMQYRFADFPLIDDLEGVWSGEAPNFATPPDQVMRDAMMNVVNADTGEWFGNDPDIEDDNENSFINFIRRSAGLAGTSSHGGFRRRSNMRQVPMESIRHVRIPAPAAPTSLQNDNVPRPQLTIQHPLLRDQRDSHAPGDDSRDNVQRGLWGVLETPSFGPRPRHLGIEYNPHEEGGILHRLMSMSGPPRPTITPDRDASQRAVQPNLAVGLVESVPESTMDSLRDILAAHAVSPSPPSQPSLTSTRDVETRPSIQFSALETELNSEIALTHPDPPALTDHPEISSDNVAAEPLPTEVTADDVLIEMNPDYPGRVDSSESEDVAELRNDYNAYVNLDQENDADNDVSVSVERLTDPGEPSQSPAVHESMDDSLRDTISHLIANMSNPTTGVDATPAIAVEEPEPAGASSDMQAHTPNEFGLVCPVGYDPEIFNSLPDFMQREIIDEHQVTTDQSRDILVAAGYDLEIIDSLPEDMRQEILEQARREQAQNQGSFSVPSDPSANQELDNTAFLASLPDDLRAEVLLTSDESFIQTLPQQYIEEANALRERAAARFQRMEMAAPREPRVEPRDRNRNRPPPPPGHSRSRGRVAEESGNLPKPVPRGLMSIPLDDVSDLRLGDDAVATLLRLLYIETVPISMRILQRLLHNISKNAELRDKLLLFIVHMLAHTPCNAPIYATVNQNALKNINGEFPPRTVLAPTNRTPTISTPEVVNAPGWTSPLIMKRLILALGYLCSTNSSVVYDILKPRDRSQFCFEISENDESENLNCLEVLIRLFDSSCFTDCSADLLSLSRLIGTLCEPLETYDASVSSSPEDGIVPIPPVTLNKYTLRTLCDALLNDLCTKDIFDQIISCISRLSNVEHNRSILMEVIAEVTVDICQQSQYRLECMLMHLNKNADVHVTKKLSIPLGEIGSQCHARLLRCLQTLHSLSCRKGCKLVDVAPMGELQAVWQLTDMVLRRLHHYLDADTERGPIDNKPQKTTVTSLLSKLLPLLESFLLIHTEEVLSNSTKIQSAEKSVTKTDSPPEAIPLSRQQSIPGAKYRDDALYHTLNISLLCDGTDERHLHRTMSLRSCNSMDSTAFTQISSLTQRLLMFVSMHKNVFNILIQQYPALLDGSFNCLIRICQLRAHIVFENKRTYFYNLIKKTRPRSNRSVYIQVKRDNVFEDSFYQLRTKSADEMRGRLVVSFANEEGVDAGGLSREWYVVLSKEIFNPNYALFTTAADGVTFQPNPLSNINTNHLDYFKFVGRVIGKALMDNQLIDGHFTRSFYKHLLGIPVEIQDIEGIDPEYYKSLKQILEYPLEDLGLDLTFSADVQTFGKHEVIDLIPNGRHIPVTDANKSDYIRFISHHSMTSAIRSQIDVFLEGFYDIVPPEHISIFSPTELELLICGLPDVDINDLKQHTEYHQYRATDNIILWFWEVLHGFSQEERALFIQFVTGTSKVPLDGFANLQGMRGPQKFSIHRAYTSHNALPCAHTCFNQLDLPEYSSQEELREKLLIAIKEGSEGFGFA